MRTSPDTGSEPAERGSRLGRALVGMVVGFAIFAFVGVVGYFAVVAIGIQSWADSRDAAASPVPEVSASGTTEAADGVGQDGLDASNEAYRQRLGSPERDAEAALSLPGVQAALDPLADGTPVGWAEVVAALDAAGFADVQVTPPAPPGTEPAATVGVGVPVPGGCVFGSVAPDAVTLEAGGPIADGGCLEATAH